ncbi:hypothetical protein PtA15_10A657 [Puccinia triticina]|uniref:Uncharacterized protein n=1 Tax=Puccinia triticina TaxID=208348 RepID=A0ABY7CY07_9BASI|nr:uncharacterized protein PtA15_10A657 [Puccinia triticina]WAQ89233.1 hypothetical protein PtA15_10A657 [Puccinia triticina]
MQPHRPSNQASDHSAWFPHARNRYNKFYCLGHRLPSSSGLAPIPNRPNALTNQTPARTRQVMYKYTPAPHLALLLICL